MSTSSCPCAEHKSMELGGDFVLCMYIAASYVGKEVSGQQNKEKSDKTVKIKWPEPKDGDFWNSCPN